MHSYFFFVVVARNSPSKFPSFSQCLCGAGHHQNEEGKFFKLSVHGSFYTEL